MHAIEEGRGFSPDPLCEDLKDPYILVIHRTLYKSRILMTPSFIINN